MRRSEPVMKDDSSLARKTAPVAISSGTPSRPSSVWCDWRAASTSGKFLT
jgi:hypothetical protein